MGRHADHEQGRLLSLHAGDADVAGPRGLDRHAARGRPRQCVCSPRAARRGDPPRRARVGSRNSLPRSKILFADHHGGAAAGRPRRRRVPRSCTRDVQYLLRSKLRSLRQEVFPHRSSRRHQRWLDDGRARLDRNGVVACRHSAQEGRRAGGDGLYRVDAIAHRPRGRGVSSLYTALRRSCISPLMTLKSRLETLVTVFGGSGFLGRHVVRALANRGYRIRLAVRRPELSGFLRPMGRVGQINTVQANLRYPQSIAGALRDADLAVNLVGILFERGAQRFDAVQSVGAEAVALAAKSTGARLVHVSAIGADANSPSHYARSKAEGERRVLAAQPAASIMRPSIVFGPEDDFFNRFAALARIAPALPLVGGGHTRFQPVFVGDVAE